MPRWAGTALGIIYSIGWVVTFVWLTFFDGYQYNAWNWLIALPLNAFSATIWPIHWFLSTPLYNFISGR